MFVSEMFRLLQIKRRVNRIHSFLLQARRCDMKAAYMLHCKGYSPYPDVDRALATHQVEPAGWGNYCSRMLQQ